MPKIIKEKQDLTYLKWSHIRSSSGTAGTLLKSSSSLDGVKKYYKLSSFDPEKGIIGHECINEIIVDRLLTMFGIEHLEYELINSEIEIEGKVYQTYLCSSQDFKLPGESKVSLDDFYRTNYENRESHYDFCVRNGWKKYINAMIALDFIILNRDRHGANIEVLRNARQRILRIAPLFDHGLSLLCSCTSENDAIAFDVLADRPCNNYIGSRSCYENLGLLDKNNKPIAYNLKPSDRDILFEDLGDILSPVFIDKIWDMIYKRYKIYENI